MLDQHSPPIDRGHEEHVVAQAPQGWHPDPLGRFELRWWDGSTWTDHVAQGGQTSQDPLEAALQEVQKAASGGASDGAVVTATDSDASASSSASASEVESVSTDGAEGPAALETVLTDQPGDGDPAPSEAEAEEALFAGGESESDAAGTAEAAQVTAAEEAPAVAGSVSSEPADAHVPAVADTAGEAASDEDHTGSDDSGSHADASEDDPAPRRASLPVLDDGLVRCEIGDGAAVMTWSDQILLLDGATRSFGGSEDFVSVSGPGRAVLDGGRGLRLISQSSGDLALSVRDRSVVASSGVAREMITLDGVAMSRFTGDGWVVVAAGQRPFEQDVRGSATVATDALVATRCTSGTGLDGLVHLDGVTLLLLARR